MKNICIIFIIFFSLSCKEDKIIFENTKLLLAERVGLDNIFYPDFVMKVKDKLVIASSRTDTTLFVYSLPSLKYLSSTGLKGQGPNEIQYFPMFCNNSLNECLYVWGFTPLMIKKISLENDGTFNYIKDIDLKEYDTFNYMTLIEDSVLIYYLPDELKIKKVNIDDFSLIDEIEFKKDDHKESFFYKNRGFVSTNEKYLIYPYLFKKQIGIYDINTFKLKTKICDDRIYSHSIPGNFNDLIRQYVNVYAGEKFIYAMYDGKKRNNGLYNNDCELEVFDYDGNPVVKYYFDIAPLHFVVDEINNYIYGFNPNEQDMLLRYAM